MSKSSGYEDTAKGELIEGGSPSEVDSVDTRYHQNANLVALFPQGCALIITGTSPHHIFPDVRKIIVVIIVSGKYASPELPQFATTRHFECGLNFSSADANHLVKHIDYDANVIWQDSNFLTDVAVNIGINHAMFFR